jgi:hypothetical protein
MGGRIMRRGNFHRLLDIHGARLQRWPSAERQSAERLLAADAKARAARDEVRRLEILLDRYAPPVDERAAGRILVRLATLPARRRQGAWWSWSLPWDEFAPAWPSLATFATVALLGILVGLGSIDASLLDPGEFDISGLVLDASPSIAVSR